MVNFCRLNLYLKRCYFFSVGVKGHLLTPKGARTAPAAPAMWGLSAKGTELQSLGSSPSLATDSFPLRASSSLPPLHVKGALPGCLEGQYEIRWVSICSGFREVESMTDSNCNNRDICHVPRSAFKCIVSFNSHDNLL